MSVTAVFEAPQTKLLYQQTAFCTGRITNNGRRPLANLNPQTIAATPTLVLTDVQTGAQTRHAKLLAQEQMTPRIALQPGASRQFDFSLTDLAAIPGPGAYDAQLHYAWDGDETLSNPVRFEFAPSYPKSADLVTTKGGVAPLQFAAFAHQPDPRDAQYQVWSAQLFLAGKPRVQHCVKLGEVKQLVTPRQSTPPNVDCALRWTGWIEGGDLRLVVQRGTDGVAPFSVKLESGIARIVPPLLVNFDKKWAPEGVDVLLQRSAGGLLVKTIDLTGKVVSERAIALPGLPPAWGTTVYPPTLRRHSFFLSFEKGKQVLRHLAWPTAANTAPAAKDAAAWPSPLGFAAATLTADDSVVGVVLVHAGDPAENEFRYVTWKVQDDGVVIDREIPIAWPDRRRGFDLAILRISAGARPFALLRAARDQVWHWCDASGAVTPLTGPAEKLQTPADIAFRGGDDPTILYTDPGRGFQFARPG